MRIMKNIYLKPLFLYAIMFFLVVLSSCSSDFLDTTPTDAISSENVWSSSNLAENVISGVYEVLLDDYDDDPWNGLWDSYSSICDLDENWLSNCAILLGTATPSSAQFSLYWQRYYEGISRANDVIANVSSVSDMSDEDKARYIAECKFLRAWFYMHLNMLYKGVPIYMEPIDADECTKGRSTEAAVWDTIIVDLTDCINEENLPDKYDSGDSDYGHVTKGAAYALRGKAYLWLEDYADAETDFESVGDCGYALFDDYSTLFKEDNEECDEMIFSVQCIDEDGLGNFKNWSFGNRNTVGYAWNNYIPNPNFVDTYDYADGEEFDYDNIFDGYSDMTPEERSVFFLRDNMTDDEIETMTEYGADMDQYLPDGNEERLAQVYDDRDPRMLDNFITPYSTYSGGCTGDAITYTLRWPYEGSDSAEPYDLRTDTNSKFYYLWRKFVYEGTEHDNLTYSPIDMPLIRYADVLLNLAEALNEEGKTDEAITYVNMVRDRAGVAELNSNSYTTVTDQADLRERIRNERYWELAGEDVLFFDELRWETWKDKKFIDDTNGMTQIWGTTTYTYTWVGDQAWTWAIPSDEMEMNDNLTQNDGWNN